MSCKDIIETHDDNLAAMDTAWEDYEDAAELLELIDTAIAVSDGLESIPLLSERPELEEAMQAAFERFDQAVTVVMESATQMEDCINEHKDKPWFPDVLVVPVVTP